MPPLFVIRSQLFEGEDVDLSIFPPACLPEKGQDFVGKASVYGTVIQYILQ